MNVMTQEEACRWLRVSLPTTENVIKTAYRRRARQEHPDISKAQDATARMARLIEAYEWVISNCELEHVVGNTSNGKGFVLTECGRKVVELGLGLGPLKNGTPCPECNAKGYRAIHSRMKDCPDCKMEEYGFLHLEKLFRCKRCGGDGVFKINGKAKGECYGCHGSDWYKPKNRYARCYTCGGLGRVEDRSGAPTYHLCMKCDGTGELEMWNPVIPKGLLSRS